MTSKSFFLTIATLILFSVTTLLFMGSSNVSERVDIPTGCEKIKIQDLRYECWMKEINPILKKHGLETSLDTMVDLYINEPRFAESCHKMTRLLGESTYHIYGLDKSNEFDEKMNICHGGFFVGFLKGYVEKTHDIKKAIDICQQIKGNMDKLGKNSYIQCYHGIGYGISHINGQRFSGDAQKMIIESLNQCLINSENFPEFLQYCSNGVFRGITRFFRGNQFGLSQAMVDKKDPFAICRGLESEYIDSCYSNAKNLPKIGVKWDFRSIMISVADMARDRVISKSAAALVIKSLAQSEIEYLISIFKYQSLEIDYSEPIDICHGLGEFGHSCIQGLSSGLLFFGTPFKEYEDASMFCRSHLLSDDEKDICFDTLLSELKEIYPSNKTKQICAYLQSNYSVACYEG